MNPQEKFDLVMKTLEETGSIAEAQAVLDGDGGPLSFHQKQEIARIFARHAEVTAPPKRGKK